jgi:acyl-coenzyme A synthetase/AMP-(fatty) acid ligase
VSDAPLFDVLQATISDGVTISSSRGRTGGRALLDSAERLAQWLDGCGHPGPLVSAVADVASIIVTMLAADRSGLPVIHVDPGDPNAPDGIHVRDTSDTAAEIDGYRDHTIVLQAARVGAGTELAGVPAGAQLFLTSGSTGTPVIVVRDAAAILADARRVIGPLSYRAGGSVVAGVPLHHVYGYNYGLIAPLLVGASIHYVGPRTLPSQLDRAIQQTGASLLVAHPAHFRMVAEQAQRTGTAAISGIDQAVSAGAPLPEGAAAAVTAHHEFALLSCYGSSEAGAVTLSPMTGTEPPGDAGSLLPGVEARSDVPAGGGDGELWLRTSSRARGYLENGRLVALDVADGWLRTGDLAVLAGDRVHLRGRLASIINVGGEKVAPEEIERVLGAHPAVADVEVRGEPDPVRGQQPVAHLMLRHDASDAELLVWCRDRLAPMKIPRRIVRHAELPRSVIGKRLRGPDSTDRR